MAAKKKRKSPRPKTRRPAPLERPRAFPRKGLGILGATLVVSVVILIAVTQWMPSKQTPPSQKMPPTEPASNTDSAVRTSDAPESAVSDETRAAAPSPQHRILKAFEGIAEEIDLIHAAESTLAEQTLVDFPNSVEARILMAKVLRHHRNSAGAMEQLQQALILAPQRGELYEEMVVIAKEKGDWQQAQTILEKGIADAPQAPGLHWHLAELLVTQGQHEAARPLLESERQIAPQNARIYYLLGQVHRQLGQYDLAQENYEEAIRLNPNHVNAYYALGSLCLKRKQRDEAKAYMETFRRLNEQFQTHVDERDQAGDVKRARQRVARFCYLSYKIYSHHDQSAVAAQLLEKAATLDPDNAVIVERLAVQAYQEKRLDRAVTLYQRALQLDPGKVIYLLNLGNIHKRMGHPEQAATFLNRAITQFPEDPRAYQTLIRLTLERRQQASHAVTLAEQVLTLQGSAENYFLLACAHYANHDRIPALQAIQMAVQRDPGNPKYRGMHEQIKRGPP